MRDWCKFFQEVEDNPEWTVKDFSVLDYLNARQHVKSCDSCSALVDRVNAEYPDRGTDFSKN